MTSPIWTCMECGFESFDPSINFPTICPTCKTIYSRPQRIFDPLLRNNDRENIAEASVVWHNERLAINRKRVNDAIEKGRRAWLKLHSYVGCDPRFIDWWETIIPSGTCQCKKKYLDFKQQDPPDFSSPESLFAWGVRIHNRVNAELVGKPQVALADAIELWRVIRETQPVTSWGD